MYTREDYMDPDAVARMEGAKFDPDHYLTQPMANQEAALRSPLVLTDDLVKKCAQAISDFDRVTPRPLTPEDQARAVLAYLANGSDEPRGGQS